MYCVATDQAPRSVDCGVMNECTVAGNQCTTAQAGEAGICTVIRVENCSSETPIDGGNCGPTTPTPFPPQ